MTSISVDGNVSESKLKPELEDPLSKPEDPWHGDYVKPRILEKEEVLHIQLFWQRLVRFWLIGGNLVLIGLAVLATFVRESSIARLAPFALGVAVLSLATSPVVAYRQYKSVRRTRFDIKKLNMIHRRILLEVNAGGKGSTASDAVVHQKRYREDMPDLISQFREEANRNRKTHNRWQTVIIVGSVGASAVTTASVFYSETRWVSVGITALVGLAAGFTGYFKYHERSFNLQQTADSIEREYEAVELRVGKYRGMDEPTAYATFADSVERLRDEQSKRQQQLDQPVEIKRED